MEPEPFDPSELEGIVGAVPWVRAVHALAQTASTNDDAARLAREGASEGTVVAADLQHAGRGRLGRRWVAEAGTSIHASWVVRPSMPMEVWPLLTFVTAVAAAEAIADRCGVRVRLKWPNDLMAGGRKLGGILAEVIPPDALVIGLGVNVSQPSFGGELASTATSLRLEGSREVRRAELLAGILARFGPAAADPAASLSAYRALCDTLGRSVRIERTGGEDVLGLAEDLGLRGELVVATPAGRVAVAAGDVKHLRIARAEASP